MRMTGDDIYWLAVIGILAVAWIFGRWMKHREIMAGKLPCGCNDDDSNGDSEDA